MLEVYIRHADTSDSRINWSKIPDNVGVVYVESMQIRGEWYEVANTAIDDTEENRKLFKEHVKSAVKNTEKLLDTPKHLWPEHLKDNPRAPTIH